MPKDVSVVIEGGLTVFDSARDAANSGSRPLILSKHNPELSLQGLSSSSLAPHTVRRALAVASESAIFDHVTLPELPEPDAATLSNQSQHVAFPARISSSSPRSSRSSFPFPPLLTRDRDLPSSSQAVLLSQALQPKTLGSPISDRPTTRPGVAITPRCTLSALPSPTVPRSGPIRRNRKDSG